MSIAVPSNIKLTKPPLGSVDYLAPVLECIRILVYDLQVPPNTANMNKPYGGHACSNSGNTSSSRLLGAIV